jgi:cytochrome c556
MNRIAVALILAACTASAAMADPITDRQQLMKGVQAATKDALPLSRGTVPFDAAKTKEVLQVYIDASAKLPSLFPAGTETGGNPPTAAAPKIWTDMPGFKASAAALGADAKTGLAATDTASFKAAFTKITADCAACHTNYRLKKD